jgi:hypothetical protein
MTQSGLSKKMKSASWKDHAELIGIAAIVVSLVFVGVELRQSHDIAINEMGFVALASFFETRDTENDHVEVWIKGNLGEELDRYEMAIYRNLVRNRHSQRFWNYAFSRTLGQENSEIPVVDLAAYLHKYPNARAVWESLRGEEDAYRNSLMPNYESDESVGFTKSVRRVLEELDQKGLKATE